MWIGAAGPATKTTSRLAWRIALLLVRGDRPMDGSAELAVAAAVPAARRRRFVAFHKADRNFFLIFVLVCWIGVIMGFIPAVTLRINGEARFRAPLILEIHAVAFSSWLIL